MPGTLIHFHKKIVCFVTAILFSITFFGQANRKGSKESDPEKYPAMNVEVETYLRALRDSGEAVSYRLKLCADVPDNRHPLKVAYQQESGHVFLILQKILPGADTLNKVFGFYPKKGLPTLFFKTISSRIKDNSYREYDVDVSVDITASQFDTVLAIAVYQSLRKYHINRFNCYDYALNIFNAVAGDSTLPVVYVRFPFIFGRGGSPCSVYKGLSRLRNSAFWGPRIRFGQFRAPVSSGRF